MTKTIQIEGMDELIEAVGSGGGGGGSIVPTPTSQDEGKVLTASDDGTASWETPSGGGGIPTPTLDDDGKVLRVVSQSQEKVAPEWDSIREVPIDGQNGQVLTKNSDGYGWANASGGLPALYGEEDKGKALIAQYDSDTEHTYPAWSIIKQVPTGGTTGQVLTKTARSYEWATPSGGGGGHIDVLKIDLNQSDFSPSEVTSGMYDASVYISGALTKINNMISISIVDNTDSGTPTFKTPTSDDDCFIFYDSDMTTIRINSTIYNFLSTREANHFYLTYYTGA